LEEDDQEIQKNEEITIDLKDVLKKNSKQKKLPKIDNSLSKKMDFSSLINQVSNN
jgi:hypothetical protein